MDPPLPDVRVSDAERERAAAGLREARAKGRLTLEEFSERLDEAYAAKTGTDLERARRQLPAPAMRSRRRAHRFALAVLGHTVRRGSLRLRRFAVALSLLGDLDLDLRDASVEHEGSTVLCFALFGNVDIYVPEAVDVEASGVTLGGHCRDWGRQSAAAGSPRVRVRVFTLFGTADLWRVPAGRGGTYGELIEGVKRRQRELPPPVDPQRPEP